MGLSLAQGLGPAPHQSLQITKMLRLLICPLLVNLATGSIITLNAAAHLPLIASGTAGGLSTVMAALGAPKLGALTPLHADTIVDSLETKTRVARSAQSFGDGDQEALFQLVT